MGSEQPALVARSADAEAIYQAHVRPIYAFIFSRVGSREVAEDITSEVFLRALAHIDPNREEHSIVAWLYRVARNAVNDYWRAGRGAQVISLDQVRVVRANVPSIDTGRQEQTARRARALLDRLPENYRTVLHYRLIEGFSVAETAVRMSTSESNVKVLQHRALKRAAELREDEGVDE